MYSSLIDVIKSKNKTLFILCGFPYSGKTYIAKKLVEATGCEYVGIDDFFYEREYDWTSNKLPNQEGWNEIFTAAYDAIKKKLRESKNVLYDSTNHTRASRDALRAVAQEIGVESAVIFVDVSTKTVWSRWEDNQTSRERPIVAKELVAMTIDSFERPMEDENVYTVIPVKPHE